MHEIDKWHSISIHDKPYLTGLPDAAYLSMILSNVVPRYVLFCQTDYGRET